MDAIQRPGSESRQVVRRDLMALLFLEVMMPEKFDRAIDVSFVVKDGVPVCQLAFHMIPPELAEAVVFSAMASFSARWGKRKVLAVPFDDPEVIAVEGLGSFIHEILQDLL